MYLLTPRAVEDPTVQAMKGVQHPFGPIFFLTCLPLVRAGHNGWVASGAKPWIGEAEVRWLRPQLSCLKSGRAPKLKAKKPKPHNSDPKIDMRQSY